MAQIQNTRTHELLSVWPPTRYLKEKNICIYHKVRELELSYPVAVKRIEDDFV